MTLAKHLGLVMHSKKGNWHFCSKHVTIAAESAAHAVVDEKGVLGIQLGDAHTANETVAARTTEFSLVEKELRRFGEMAFFE
jgi:hypothetical protein